MNDTHFVVTGHNYHRDIPIDFFQSYLSDKAILFEDLQPMADFTNITLLELYFRYLFFYN